MQFTLPIVWWVMIGFFLLYYAVTDGFALGMGIISLFYRDDRKRALLMASLESTWHDHQTWLVLLGGMMFGAFPLFYSLVLSALYIPMVVMLFGIVLRGVSFEFREVSNYKRLWGLAFGVGSLMIAIAQGFGLGGLLGGLEIQNAKFVGSVWGWLTPYSALIVLGVLFGYVMLGANFVIFKTEGEIQEQGYRYSLYASIGTIIVALIVHVWTMAKYPHIAEKWNSISGYYPMLYCIFLALISLALFYHSLWKRYEIMPLFWNAAIILFSFIALSLGMYPYMIPNLVSPVTVEQAAAHPMTLTFMLIATSILLPIILIYTGFKYRIFSGKTREAGYREV